MTGDWCHGDFMGEQMGKCNINGHLTWENMGNYNHFMGKYNMFGHLMVIEWGHNTNNII